MRQGSPHFGPTEIDREGRFLFRPFTSKSLDRCRRDAGHFLGPGGCFLYTVVFAQNMSPESLEADGVARNISLIVGALGYPNMGDCKIQCSVGIGLDRDPLIGVNGGGVV